MRMGLTAPTSSSRSLTGPPWFPRRGGASSPLLTRAANTSLLPVSRWLARTTLRRGSRPSQVAEVLLPVSYMGASAGTHAAALAATPSGTAGARPMRTMH